MARWALLLLLGADGCGGSPSPDAGTDSGPPDAALDAAADAGVPVPPELPRFTPCPPGWRELPPSAETPFATCDPYPEGGPDLDCAAWEAHFPGEPGCRPAGAACPAGDWPEDLPSTGVVYVRPDAAPGGDGSRDAPFATIAEALGAAPEDGIIALAAAVFREWVLVTRAIEIRGACAETTVLDPLVVPRGTTVQAFGPPGGRARIVLRDLRITGPGAGISSSLTNLQLEGVVVHDVGEWGISVNSTDLTAHGLIVRDVQTLLGTTEAPAVNVGTNGTAELSRCFIERAVKFGVGVQGFGGTAHLSDIAIRSIRPPALQGEEEFGQAVLVQSESTATIERGWFDDNAAFGLFVGDASSATLTDVVVRDVHPGAVMGDPSGGDGVHVELGTVRAERLRIEDARNVGIAMAGGRVERLHDVHIRRTAAAATFRGHAIEVTDGAAIMDGRRLFIEDAGEVGLLVDGAGASVRAEDVVVVRTVSNAVSGLYGRAFQVQRGAMLEAARVRLSGNHEVSAGVASAGSELVLTDVVIEDTFPRACAETTCAGAGAGSGLAALEDGHARVTSFVLRRSVLAGLQLARGGTADLSVGVIAENLVGANVQTEGFDLARIQDRVVYRDNGRDLDSTMLPVPDPELGR